MGRASEALGARVAPTHYRSENGRRPIVISVTTCSLPLARVLA
ncbi:MAG: hypothetical protein ACREHF_14395 [Rhizomicrobium sp.]